MDFTIALTHFCEVHGPKSVLCSQVLPLECSKCDPAVPQRNQSTSESFESPTPRNQAAPYIPEDEHAKLPRDLPSDVGPSSPTQNIEQHPWFRHDDYTKELRRFPYGRAHGETCASCTFTVPQKVAARLPEGAPGSLSKEGGKSVYGAPVLRSREFICLGKHRRRHDQVQPGSSQESQSSSLSSSGSTVSHVNCHDHTLTYLTSKSPDDPENYAQLRTAIIRALSCEVLPRGMPEGPFCFGDSSTGYTIAYVFRLPDPKARGRRRTYAFVALAGKDAYNAFKACPMLWSAFATMSRTIEDLAQKAQDEQELRQQKQRDEQSSTDANKGYTEISSFLTQRPRDPDGQPRRAGQTQPRSLAEILGKEDIFLLLHHHFVQLLRCLGDKFGGLPLAQRKESLQIGTSPQLQMTSPSKRARVSSDMLANLSLDDQPPAHADQPAHARHTSVTPSTETARSVASTSSTVHPAETTPQTIQTSDFSKAAPATTAQSSLTRNNQCGATVSVDHAQQRRVAV